VFIDGFLTVWSLTLPPIWLLNQDKHFLAMSEISKTYNPAEVENQWYADWMQSGAFSGVSDTAKDPYAVMIPPPNVTGVLTMGHVLNNTIQDILVRRARLNGKAALWLPGTDHASIATHARIEKRLRDEGTHRRELGRDKFLERAWEWSNEHGGIILKQLRSLGASCDWNRTVFTMDPKYSDSVLHAFIELYKRGYIYRGKRMVNWCPATQSALSDEEVIMKAQKGFLYKMRYELCEPTLDIDGNPLTHLEISTTRPETIMGDTAVAVHPEDPRYQHLIGKEVYRPFPRARIPIIVDAAVDRSFGTGCLKVTPAHDKLDFEIGQRHNLPILDVMHSNGVLNDLAGEPFAGQDRFAARKLAVQMLREMDLLIKEEPYENHVGYSERKDVPIEPRLSMQWWMRYPKVAEARTAVERGMIRFWPQRWEKTYLHWLENIQDWCISRQLWWGQRIPVWYRVGIDPETADIHDPSQVRVQIEAPEDTANWVQDEDVLDTWASSWLWPFATLGWPNPTEEQKRDLKYFYPTTDLVTGPDIIFFWVARMIMAGLEFMGEAKETLTLAEIAERIPFRNVYFTGIIRDEKGRKMSKSLGNSPDPLDLIAEFGADGLRFGIMSVAPKGQDILFSKDRINIGRNLCNKLWNACRFRQMSGEMADNSSLEAILGRIRVKALDDYDHWIIARLLNAVAVVDEAFEQYEFNQLTQKIYDLFWGDFCDWYVEVSKSKLQSDFHRGTCLAVQDLFIRQVLLLLNPVCPFITEALWHQLGYGSEGTFIQNVDIEHAAELRSALQKSGVQIEFTAVDRIEALKEFVSKARNLKASYDMATRREVTLYYTADSQYETFIKSNAETLKRLIGAMSLEARSEGVEGAPAAVSIMGTVYLDLSSSIDVEAERVKLSNQLEKLSKAISSAEAKLANETFTSKAPPQIIDGVRSQLAHNVDQRTELMRLLQNLDAL
jgi:valyl-tRNA synthetase